LDSFRTKHAQFRFPKLPSIVAAPALLGLVAAIALSAQSNPGAAAGTASGHRTVSVAGSQAVSSALLVSAIHAMAASKPAAVRRAGATVAVTYTVRPGDTLSSIALRFYHDAGAWPALYAANRNQVRWANLIRIGQVLTVPARAGHVSAAPRAIAHAHAPAAEAPTVVEQSAPARTVTSTAGYSSFQACVIARESGGRSQVMNSTGHYGLYQFSASTWAAYGGDPAEFGHATVAEQNRVFDNAMAAGGEFNWAPYDGC